MEYFFDNIHEPHTSIEYISNHSQRVLVGIQDDISELSKDVEVDLYIGRRIDLTNIKVAGIVGDHGQLFPLALIFVL